MVYMVYNVCDLSGIVESSDISNQGIRTSLIQKTENACSLYEAGNIKAARNILYAFINEVEAQEGKHISTATANMLIEFVTNIIASM